MSEDIDAPSETDPSRAVMERREEIAPCPFCGGPAEIVEIDEGENAGGSCVSCTLCLASSNVEFEFKENFISNWNRRALPEPPPSRGGGWRPGPFAEVHELKTWPEFYEAVEDERKPWELREFDRPYKVGDILHLREWRPHTERYSGRECWRGVTYLFVGDGGWLPKGKCIMGLARYQPSPAPLAPDGASELAEALAALEPFLRVAEVDIGQDEADDDLFRNMSAAHARAPRITVGHVRRAAQAAARLRSQGSE